ncbi:hypothetical protein Shal_1746 [Shewanella halifaxensis HAW-EB4]|uniref:Uncharacterized protein n=2 Tax=Shewanella halifaxensis TaxID=271098 RepID=B0TQR7_SHEHH|nr:hypothetical protein Shal_1746 [Shewanella halifaxensis HAW-EB4]
MDNFGDIDEHEVMESFRKMKRHVGIVYFMNTAKHDSYRNIDDPNYREPTNAEVAEVIETMIFIGHTKTDIARMLGIKTVSKDKTKVLRKWCDGEPTDTSSIPHSSWVHLLVLSGKICLYNAVPEEGWTRG